MRRTILLLAVVGAALLLGVMMPQEPAHAATFTVNSTADAVDANPGNGTCATAAGNCTLRAAVQEANATTGADTINLRAATYTLTIPESAGAEGGDLDIRNDVTINGAGRSSTTIDGNQESRVFEIGQDDQPDVNPSVQISALTVANGDVTQSIGAGAGIVVWVGSFVELREVVVRDNLSSIYGGGIYNEGQLNLFQSTVANNAVNPGATGGGVTATGGGIFNYTTGVLSVFRSTISGNRTSRGGGINNQGRVEIRNSTISGNSVYGAGGGIRNVGISTTPGSGVLNISWSTITNNEANRSGSDEQPENRRTGGGIYNSGGVVTMANSILAENTNNTFPSSTLVPHAPDCYSISPSQFTSRRDNLVGVLNANCNMSDFTGTAPTFDLTGTSQNPLDPQLEVLADNGGATQTHALLPTSPAIDADQDQAGETEPEPFFECPLTDQRGATRPADGDGDGTAVCDIGAFERVPPPQIRINNAQVTEGNSGTKTINFTVSLSAPSVQTVSVFFATANGTATAPSDYTAVSGTRTFTAGQTAKTISVAVRGDTRREPNETFRVNLSSATNATIADGVGVGTIINND